LPPALFPPPPASRPLLDLPPEQITAVGAIRHSPKELPNQEVTAAPVLGNQQAAGAVGGMQILSLYDSFSLSLYLYVQLNLSLFMYYGWSTTLSTCFPANICPVHVWMQTSFELNFLQIFLIGQYMVNSRISLC
jgi:hypothetical protein